MVQITLHINFTYKSQSAPLRIEILCTVPVVSRMQYSCTILQVMAGWLQ